MKTSEYLIYGTIIFLLYKLYKNTQPGNNIDQLNKAKSINLPPFAIVTPTYFDKKQIQPTPAEVLNPKQLAYFNSKNKAILKQIYTC